MPIEEHELLSRFKRALEGIGADECSTESAQNLRDLVVRTLDSGILFLAKENQVPAANDR